MFGLFLVLGLALYGVSEHTGDKECKLVCKEKVEQQVKK